MDAIQLASQFGRSRIGAMIDQCVRQALPVPNYCGQLLSECEGELERSIKYYEAEARMDSGGRDALSDGTRGDGTRGDGDAD